jgi:hypothetical protein
MGNGDIEDSLERLDKLTQEEARMASAEQLKMMHNVRVDVQDVRVDVQDVRGDVRDVGSDIRGVDDKLDQVNRSLSVQILIVIPRAQAASQGTSSEIVSCDGFRPQIHPSIITSHAKPITTAQLNGSSKEVYLISGNPLAPSCGYTENVCHS